MDNIELKKIFETNNISLNVQNYVFGETNTPPSNITGLDWVNFFVKLIKAGYDAKNEVVSKLLYLSFKTHGANFYLTEIKRFLKTDEDFVYSLEILKSHNVDISNVLKQFVFTISAKNESFPFVINYLYENFKETLNETVKYNSQDNDKRSAIIKIIKTIDKPLANEMLEGCIASLSRYSSGIETIKFINLFDDEKERQKEILKLIVNSFANAAEKSIVETFVKGEISFEIFKDRYTFGKYYSKYNVAVKNMEIALNTLEQNFNDEFYLKIFKIAIVISNFEHLNLVVNIDNYMKIFEMFSMTYKDFVYFLVQKYKENYNINYTDSEFDILNHVLKNEYDKFIENLPLKELTPNFINIIYKTSGEKSFDFLIYLTEQNISSTVENYIYSLFLNEKSKKVYDFAEKEYNSKFKIKKEIAIKLLLESDNPDYEKIFKELLITEEKNKTIFPMLENYFAIRKIMEKFNIPLKTAKFLSIFSNEANIHKGSYKTIDVKSLKKLIWIHNNKEFSDKETTLIFKYFENFNDDIKNLKILTTKESQIEFAKDVYLKWNRENKTVWMLRAVSYFGDDSLVEPLKNEIITLGENKRGAVASTMVIFLALMNTRKSLQTVNYMLHKVKQKQIKAAAEQALKDAAIQLNLTKDDMLDKLIEDFGFNKDGIIELSYGTRKFYISMNVDLELMIKDETGKVIKSLPKANSSDDAVKAEEANTLFKNLKKTLKDETKVQLERLEENFAKKRYWTVENWVDLFVNNPVMKKFAITLIWGLYENDKPIITFRYNEDGTYSDANDNTITLNNNYYVSMIHPIELKPEEIELWKTIITDYEIKQPFNQINREIFQKETSYEVSIEKFKDKQVGSLSLRNKLTKAGFVPNANYSGEFSSYIKDIEGQNITIAVNFSGDNTKNYATSIDCTMKNIAFYKTDKVKDYYSAYKLFPQHMILIKEISAVLYSEICYLISSVTK